MKKLIKPFMIVGAIVIIIGLGVAIAALAMGAELSTAVHFNLENLVEEKMENNISLVAAEKKIDELDIQLEVGTLKIQYGDDFYIAYSDYDDGVLSYGVDGNALYVREKKHVKFFNFSLINRSPTIILTIPTDYYFDEVDISMSVGSLQIDSLFTKEFELKNGVGEMKITHLTAEDAKITGDVGSIYIDGAIQNLEYQGGIGEFTFLGTGNPDDYQYNVKSGVGEVTVNSKHYSGLGTAIDFGDGEGRIKISTGVGKATVIISE